MASSVIPTHKYRRIRRGMAFSDREELETQQQSIKRFMR
jgi:hypothetical protein